MLKNGWSSSGKQNWGKFTSRKIDFINDAQAKEVDYWKRAALGSKNEDKKSS